MHRPPFAALLLSALVAACGSGGDDATLADDNTGYYPLGNGNRWVYDNGDQSRVTGQREADGQRWWVVETVDSGGTSEGLLRKDSQGVHARFQTPTFGTLSYTLIRLPVVVGATNRLYDYRLPAFFDYDRNGTADDVEVTTDTTVIGFENVSTPAGNFAGALRMRLTSTSTVVYRPQGTRAALSSGTSDVWLADGIGPVRTTDTDTDPVSGDVTTSTSALTGYQVGTRTGGTLPPR